MKTMALIEDTDPRRPHSLIRSVVLRSRPQSSAFKMRHPVGEGWTVRPAGSSRKAGLTENFVSVNTNLASGFTGD
jgi:hypothetical protein